MSSLNIVLEETETEPEQMSSLNIDLEETQTEPEHVIEMSEKPNEETDVPTPPNDMLEIPKSETEILKKSESMTEKPEESSHNFTDLESKAETLSVPSGDIVELISLSEKVSPEDLPQSDQEAAPEEKIVMSEEVDLPTLPDDVPEIPKSESMIEKPEASIDTFVNLEPLTNVPSSTIDFELISISSKIFPEDLPQPDQEAAPEQIVTEKKKKKKKIKKTQIDMKKIFESLSEASTYSSLLFNVDSNPTITGDFVPVTPGVKKQSIQSYHTTPSEVTEEEDEEEVEEEEVYDLDQLYEYYDELHERYQEEKLKNEFLVKRLINYYKTRKMIHVLFESGQKVEKTKMYEKRLLDYDREAGEIAQEMLMQEDELRELKEKFALKRSQAEETFVRLQREENELGKEIIQSESGKHYESKIIDRYLKRQEIQMNNLLKIRLHFIKIRNDVTETQNALDALDNLGSNLHLIDYEQLKIDNTNLRDKFEDKELELQRVRRRCHNTLQVLAHTREKNATIDEDIDSLNNRYKNVLHEYEDCREQLIQMKNEKDMYRKDIDRLKENSGLLSKRKLLRDMQVTIDEEKDLAKQVEQLKREYYQVNRKVTKIRENRTVPTKLAKIIAIMKGEEPRVETPELSFKALRIEPKKNSGKIYPRPSPRPSRKY